VRDARGSPRRPLSAAELGDKLRICAAPLLGDRLDSLSSLCARVETIGDVRELASLLGPPS
jgi:hypothetical protein